MKKGIQKLVNNVENVQILEVKAKNINTESIKFKKNAEELKKKMKYNNLLFKIILAVISISVVLFLIYNIIH